MTHHVHYTADQAITWLMEGNARYVAGRLEHPHQNPARRADLAAGQQPFAAILSCSDSRVPPELLFDQGLGDLFVVRTAGNLADDIALGSLEYAVEHLRTPLLVVLGHQKCGAVTAAVQGGTAPGHIAAIVDALQPIVQTIPAGCAAPVDFATRAHVLRLAAELRANPLLAAGEVRIVGAFYQLDSGLVTLLEP